GDRDWGEGSRRHRRARQRARARRAGHHPHDPGDRSGRPLDPDPARGHDRADRLADVAAIGRGHRPPDHRQGMGRGSAGERISGEGRNAGGMGKGRAMDTRGLHGKGVEVRPEVFGRDAVEQRLTPFGAFGEPLQNMINAYAYGDVWSRSALPLKTKSLAAIAMTAAIGRANELRVHVNGALTNGCTAEEIRDILLLVALYCGIPAAIEGQRIALDVLRERGAA